MKPVTRIRGRASPYPVSNVDTDQIVPARFMYRNRSDGYGDTLFHDLRLDAQGNKRADFFLNRSEYEGPKVLVSGQNFGCGSSRESAVWALHDHGVECVIAPSFSDIFRNNALENGFLTVVLSEDAVVELQSSITNAAPCNVEVDLSTQLVTGPTGVVYPFEFDAHAKQNLLNGLSKVDATLGRRAEIDAFTHRYRQQFPWAV
jgi:3-isopropylmalate/(R)-2-methylmalate dehydratase small subunit